LAKKFIINVVGIGLSALNFFKIVLQRTWKQIKK